MDPFFTGSMVQKSLPMTTDLPQKKKIAVIENSLFSTYTMRDNLMKRLMKEGYDITILTHTNSFVSHVEKTGLRVINIGSGNLNPFKIFKIYFKLISGFKKN